MMLPNPFSLRFFATIKTPKRFTTMPSLLRRKRRSPHNLCQLLLPLSHQPKVLLFQQYFH